jgi:hypothetical protein
MVEKSCAVVFEPRSQSGVMPPQSMELQAGPVPWLILPSGVRLIHRILWCEKIEMRPAGRVRFRSNFGIPFNPLQRDRCAFTGLGAHFKFAAMRFHHSPNDGQTESGAFLLGGAQQ